MGFKTAGFPHYGFNPPGFRASDPLASLKKCGLTQLVKSPATDGILTDKVGKQSRPAIRGSKVVGNASVYFELDIAFANDPVSYLDATTKLVVNTNLDANARIVVPTNGMAYLEGANIGKFNFETTGDEPTVYSSDTGIQAQVFLKPADFHQYDDTIESVADRVGYSVSRGFGVNQLVEDYELGSISTSTGSDTANTTRCRTANTSYVERSKEYTVKLNNLVDGREEILNLYEYDVGMNYLGTTLLDSTQSTFTTKSETAFVRFNLRYNDNSTLTGNEFDNAKIQLELGSTPTAYEAYQGYFYDSALTQPIPQGELIPNLAPTYSLSTAYIEGGVNPPAQYVGEIKKDMSVVDGVVNADVIAWEQGSMLSGDGSNQPATNRIRTIGYFPFYPGETHTFEFNDSEYDIGIYEYQSDETYIKATVWITSSGTIIGDALSGLQRVTIRFKTNDTIIPSEIDNVGFKIYRGTTEPTSGQPVSGNSLIDSQVYTNKAIVDASETWTDKTDPSNVVLKVVPVDDLVTDNQTFVTKDGNGDIEKVGFFETTLTGDCLTKAQNYF